MSSSSVSIQQLVEETMATQNIEKRCEECGHERATMTTKLVKLPRVMLLYLKRYEYQTKVGGGKVTREVDIPDTLGLQGMIREDVEIPDSSLPGEITLDDVDPIQTSQVSSTQPTPSSLPSTPMKEVDTSQLSYEHEVVVTPLKFKGKTNEEILGMNEEDQVEYSVLLSQRTALDSSGHEAADQEYRDALVASLVNISPISGGDNHLVEQTWSGGGEEAESEDPSRKRLRLGDTPTTAPVVTPTTAPGPALPDTPTTSPGDTPTTALGPSPILRDFLVSGESRSSEKTSWKRSHREPKNKEEEDADLLKALENSMFQEDGGSLDHPESTAVLDNNHSSVSGVVSGPPELTYSLSSIVSHIGRTTTSGHYVADVLR